MPELRDLDSPEFAPIRARLARAYLEHKADIGAAHADDAPAFMSRHPRVRAVARPAQ